MITDTQGEEILMLEKAGAYVVLFELGNVGHASYELGRLLVA
jgi:hypothetical protein